MPTFRSQLESYLRDQATPPHKFAHQPRLYALTLQIAAGLHPAPVYDDDIVFAAAFLHDLGVFVGHRPENPDALKQWDHIAYVTGLAPDLLTSFGFPAEKIPAVLACIREHLPNTVPQSLEATLLRDADILEQLGAIGILRTAAKLDNDTRFHLFADVRRSLTKSLDTLPTQIHLDSTRALAAPRIATLRAFLTALDSEAGPHLG